MSTSRVQVVVVPLDVLDSWHDLADRLSLDILAHFDADHTKTVTREAMLDVSRRVGYLAHTSWLLGHSLVDGRWVPPTRYMRHMANGAPPPEPEDAFSDQEGLDVERLSRALIACGWPTVAEPRWAEAIAREYAALAATEGDDAPDCGITGCPLARGHRGQHADPPLNAQEADRGR